MVWRSYVTFKSYDGAVKNLSKLTCNSAFSTSQCARSISNLAHSCWIKCKMPGIVYFVPESFSWIWEETGTFPPLSFSMSTWSYNFLLHESRHYISTRQSIGSARGTPRAPKKPSFDLSLIPTTEAVGPLKHRI